MFRAIALLFTLTALLVSCSGPSEKKAPVKPELTVQQKDGKCLDLQAAVEHMDSAGFRFPAFVYTRNFEVQGQPQARPEYINSLYAKSLRTEKRDFRGLTDLRGLKQQGCETVTVPDFGNKNVTYKIINYSKISLEFELDKDALESQFEEMSVHHKKALLKTPSVQKYNVIISGPTAIEVTSHYLSIPSECYQSKGMRIREDVIYNWGRHSPPAAAHVSSAYWTKLNDLAKTQGIVEWPQPQSAEFVSLDFSSGHPTVNSLQAYAHPHCF